MKQVVINLSFLNMPKASKRKHCDRPIKSACFCLLSFLLLFFGTVKNQSHSFLLCMHIHSAQSLDRTIRLLNAICCVSFRCSCENHQIMCNIVECKCCTNRCCYQSVTDNRQSAVQVWTTASTHQTALHNLTLDSCSLLYYLGFTDFTNWESTAL